MVTPEELQAECILPGVGRLRETTSAVAAAVALAAVRDTLTSVTVDSARCLPELQRADTDGDTQRALVCVQRLQYAA